MYAVLAGFFTLGWRGGGAGGGAGGAAAGGRRRSLFDECGKSGTEVWQIAAKAAKECNDTLWDLSDNDSD